MTVILAAAAEIRAAVIPVPWRLRAIKAIKAQWAATKTINPPRRTSGNMVSSDRFRNRPNRRLRFFDHLVSSRRRCPVAQIRTLILSFFLLAGVTGVVLPDHA